MFRYISAATTSWMKQNANLESDEWSISPSSRDKAAMSVFYSDGAVRGFSCYESISHASVRPTINLLSTTQIDTNHTGSFEDPYTLS